MNDPERESIDRIRLFSPPNFYFIRKSDRFVPIKAGSAFDYAFHLVQVAPKLDNERRRSQFPKLIAKAAKTRCVINRIDLGSVMRKITKIPVYFRVIKENRLFLFDWLTIKLLSTLQ